MNNKVFLVLLLVGVALADHSPHGPPPAHHQPTYNDQPMPHSFEYSVSDDYAGTKFGHGEESDGNTVRGSYNVDLPDGRKQTVNYEADDYKGYVANVQYQGEAQHPHQYSPPQTYKPQYQPAYGR
ncbi:pro-resilin-like [Panulirus ornatus]|uniref:pro-resilin-like n=1 Tax=Panulirus ornatus TaxID=150431 RepID=UPI003A8AC789